MNYVILLISGVIAGILASLFGFGGGLTVVPALILCLPMLHVAPGLTMHIAIGTSFGVMLFSNINAAVHHHKSNNLDLNIFKSLVPWVVIGIVTSLAVCSTLSSQILQYIFAGFVIFVIIKFIIKYSVNKNVEPEQKKFVMPDKKSISFTGVLTGLISGCIGGGSSMVVVPFLNHRHLELKKSVAVSTACNIILAAVGFTGSIVTGLKAGSLPHYSLGFIYLPVLIILLAGSYIGVPIGAKIANRVRESFMIYGYLAVLFIIFSIVSVKLFIG